MKSALTGTAEYRGTRSGVKEIARTGRNEGKFASES